MQISNKCPRCGAALIVPDVALWDAHTAPFLCTFCHTGFWASELTPEALEGYDAVKRTHCVPVRYAARQEHEEAIRRGHSISELVLPALTARQQKLMQQLPLPQPVVTPVIP